MRKYNKNNCQSSVRAIIKDGSTTITLMGTHAFEWTIMKATNGTIYATTFPTGREARKRWKDIVKAYKK